MREPDEVRGPDQGKLVAQHETLLKQVVDPGPVGGIKVEQRRQAGFGVGGPVQQPGRLVQLGSTRRSQLKINGRKVS